MEGSVLSSLDKKRLIFFLERESRRHAGSGERSEKDEDQHYFLGGKRERTTPGGERKGSIYALKKPQVREDVLDLQK